MSAQPPRKLRSRLWFDDPNHASMTVLYAEHFMNYDLVREGLQSGRPIIGITQTGNDLVSHNQHYLELAQRMEASIRDAGGIPVEFPVHPLAEQSRRPTTALDCNLVYLGLVEVLHGLPFSGATLATRCDKITPVCLMTAATVDLPAIVLSGGPMPDDWHGGERVGFGTVIWHARNRLTVGDIDYEGFMELTTMSSPSIGYCNAMDMTLLMSGLAEALGMPLFGCTSIPVVYRERGQMAYATDKRIVDLVREDVRPSTVMTRLAFENVIMVASALGTSTNCPPHLIVIARHMGVGLSLEDWQHHEGSVPPLVNCIPAGEYLGESFHHSGGVPAVLRQLNAGGLLRRDCPTVSGRTVGAIAGAALVTDHEVIPPVDASLKYRAGFIVLSGNSFDSTTMKMSVVGETLWRTYLSESGTENAFEAHAIVSDGSEDYYAHISSPALATDERCILTIRGRDTVGCPGSVEVANMAPSAALAK